MSEVASFPRCSRRRRLREMWCERVKGRGLHDRKHSVCVEYICALFTFKILFHSECIFFTVSDNKNKITIITQNYEMYSKRLDIIVVVGRLAPQAKELWMRKKDGGLHKERMSVIEKRGWIWNPSQLMALFNDENLLNSLFFNYID